MCGIAGFAGWPLSSDEGARTVRAMCDAITHRGPDDSGYFVAPEVALGMRRLSIIDVAGGQQPIGNARTAQSRWCSTARSITTTSCRATWSPAGTAFGRGATPRRLFICTRRWERTASPNCADVRDRLVGRRSRQTDARPGPRGDQAAELLGDAGRDRLLLGAPLARRAAALSAPADERGIAAFLSLGTCPIRWPPPEVAKLSPGHVLPCPRNEVPRSGATGRRSGRRAP